MLWKILLYLSLHNFLELSMTEVFKAGGPNIDFV